MHNSRPWSRGVRAVQWTFALAVTLILLDLANMAWQGRVAEELRTALAENCDDLYTSMAVPQSAKSRPWCALLLHVRPNWSSTWMSRMRVVGDDNNPDPDNGSITVCDYCRYGLVMLKEKYWESLWRQPELTYVRLNARDMPRESLRTLEGHPKLRSLMLINTALRDDDCAVFATLPNLKHVALSSPHLTDRCLEHLKDLPLEELWLKSPGLTGEALKVMARMPGPDGQGLRYLGLLEAAVEDEDLECLQGHQLLGLELAHTQITDLGIAPLGELKNTKVMNVVCNERVTRQTVAKLMDHMLSRKDGRPKYPDYVRGSYCTCFGRQAFERKP